MSLTTLIPEARTVLTSYASLTAQVAATKISFAQRPQGAQKPGIVVSMGPTEYEPTMGNATALTVYRIDYHCFAETAQSAATIHELIKAAVLAHTSSDFDLRLVDEAYFVDVDNVHRTTLSVNFITVS